MIAPRRRGATSSSSVVARGARRPGRTGCPVRPTGRARPPTSSEGVRRCDHRDASELLGGATARRRTRTPVDGSRRSSPAGVAPASERVRGAVVVSVEGHTGECGDRRRSGARARRRRRTAKAFVGSAGSGAASSRRRGEVAARSASGSRIRIVDHARVRRLVSGPASTTGLRRGVVAAGAPSVANGQDERNPLT